MRKLNLVINVSRCLGIRPSPKKITIFQKLYSLFMVAILTATVAVSSIDRGYLQSYTHIKFVISILTDIIAYVFNCYTILSTSFRHQKQWNSLMAANHNERRNYDCLVFIIFNVIFWLIIVGSNYAFTRIVVFKTVQDILVIDAELYTQFLFGYLIDLITDLLVVKHRRLRNHLESYMDQIRIKTLTSHDFLIFIKKIERLAYTLKQNQDDFNVIFGIPLLLMISYATLHFVNYVDDLFFFRFEPEKMYQFFASNVALVAMIFLGNCLLIVKCDTVRTEAARVVDMTYRLRRLYPCVLSRERTEVNELINFVVQHFPRFSAFGFFAIEKGTIFSILGTATTLLIVMVQFDSTKS